MHLFIVIDNNGASQIASLALAAFEKEKVFNCLLNHFTIKNSINVTKVILSDKDMVEANGFKKYFPNANTSKRTLRIRSLTLKRITVREKRII